MSVRFRLLWCITALSIIVGTALVGTARAQTPAVSVQTGSSGKPGLSTIHGTVTDPDDELIPGATVTVSNSGGKSVVGTSSADGNYSVTVAPGTYSLIFAMPGFVNLQKQSIRVAPGQTATFNAKMIVGDVTQQITVNADQPTVSVDAGSNASATVIRGKDLDALSDDPDELSSELSALAGPAPGPNGGQIYVDGFTGGQLPPKSSIREIRINQNPFSAQYDKVGFGRIEVFTKPGTDRLRGYLSIQGNDQPFNTSNPFLGAANSQPGYYTFFALGSLSGPISKSASYNVGGSIRQYQLNGIIDPTGFYATSPTDTAPCAPGNLNCNFYSTYPASARAVQQPSTRGDIAPRVDIAFGQKNVLTARYQFEGQTLQNSGAGNITLQSAGSNTSSTENEVQLSDTQTVSDKLINETRFEYQREASNQTPNSTAPFISVQGAFNSGGSASQGISTQSTHIELQNYTSMARGAHFILFGGRLRTTGQSNTSNAGQNGAFTYSYLLDPCTNPAAGSTQPSACAGITTPCTEAAASDISSYQCGTPSQFRITTIGQPTVHARETDLGVYAEDQWKARPNFTFNYGLRFEAQNGISSTHDFAPRLSMAYGIPRSGGKAPVTVLRAGSGYFFDRFDLSNFLTVAQLTPGVQTQSTYLNPGAACTPANLQGCTSGGVTPGLTTQYSLGPNIRSAYTLQNAVGVDQQLGKLGTISLNYLSSRGDHEFLTRVTPAGNALDYQFQSGGVFRENQLYVTTSIRTATLSIFGFYSLNFVNANTTSAGFIPTSSNPGVDYGRATFSQTNQAAFGGTWNAPYKISVSPFTILRSGTPYNVTTGIDENGDSIYNDRPAFLPGQTSANCSNASSFLSPQPGTSYTEIPINYCTGPASITFNLRLSRSFGFGPPVGGAATSSGDSGGEHHSHSGGGPGGGGPPGGGPPGSGSGGSHSMGGGGASTGRNYNLTLGAQAQDLFNNVNYSSPVSTLTSTQFGTFTQLLGRPFGTPNAVRVISLQATFNF